MKCRSYFLKFYRKRKKATAWWKANKNCFAILGELAAGPTLRKEKGKEPQRSGKPTRIAKQFLGSWPLGQLFL
jgi:hypothetical protein